MTVGLSAPICGHPSIGLQFSDWERHLGLNHLPECASGLHHGQHVFHLVDPNIHQDGTRVLEGLAHGPRHRPRIPDAQGLEPRVDEPERGQIRELGPTRLVWIDTAGIAFGGPWEAGLVVIPAIHHVLPLAHHPQIAVVEHEYLHRDTIGDQGPQFLDVHLEAAVAIDEHHGLIRVRVPGPDGGRESKAHGPQSPGADPLAWAHEPIVLGRPHLVLAHAGHQGSVTRGQLRNGLDDRLRLDGFPGAVRLGHPLPPGADLRQPGRAPGAVTGRQRMAQKVTEIGDQGRIRLDRLADLRGVYIHMGDTLARGEVLHGHPVIEAAPQGQNEVRIPQRIIGGDTPVHTRHPQVAGMPERHGAQCVEGGCHRDLEALDESQQELRGAGMDDAAARLDHRTLGPQQGGDDGIRLLTIERGVLAVALARGVHRPHRRQLGILTEIHDHGAGSAGGGQVEGLMQDPLQVRHILDQIVVLGDGTGQTDGVDLLKRIGPDREARDLSGDEYRRNRVLIGIGDRGSQVGRPRARGNQGDADPTTGPGIALGRMPGPPLLTEQHEPGRPLAATHAPVQLHMQGDDGAPGMAEQVGNLEIAEDIPEDAGAGAVRMVHRENGFRWAVFREMPISGRVDLHELLGADHQAPDDCTRSKISILHVRGPHKSFYLPHINDAVRCAHHILYVLFR